ncbi:MAG TPA: tetratricopeptide repeat protein [Terriglobia bacterium]|nr:tetratricopeptide repeat protein [Terriglobia bacterium]
MYGGFGSYSPPPEEGWTRHQEDAAKPPLMERTGWSLTSQVTGERPPRLRGIRWLRDFLLTAQPPLLGKEGNGPDSRLRLRGSLSILLLPLLLFSCGALWQSDTKSPFELARTGMYKDAAAALEPMVTGGNFDPLVVESLYFSWVRTGEYIKARDKFEAWATANPNAGAIHLAAGRVNHLIGNYDGALVHLNTILNNANVGIAAQYEKATVLEDTGKREEAEAIYKKLIENFQKGAIRTPNDLHWVARALWATEYYHDANDVFKVVTQGNARNAEAFVAWGDLLAEKYNEPEAIASYQDALKIDPNMPEAHIGMATALADSEPEKAAAALDRAMKTNPNLIEGHLLIAEQDIDSEQYDKAQEEIGKALAVNPKSAESLSFLASINFLQTKTEEFNKYVKQVLEINPQYSKLYDIIADNCVKLRLYKEAVASARQALRLNPRDWTAMSTLGVNLLRIGEEEEGKAALDKAYEGDQFNVMTVNTLKLLDSFEHFVRFDTPHFKVKLQEKEVAVLRPYVSELLERAYDTLTAKYEFKPDGPITFEMYPDHADFAVRTLGLPGIGALGVCFGKLFVMDSPTARKPDSFNWGSTLWHEFTHVITLQITDHKVPRWFSEGLSVYEERKGFTGWGDKMKLDYLAAIKGKKLLPTADLNNGFIRPKYENQVLVSYYQASLICDYIDQKFGFPAIKKMLLLYKQGKGTADVFKEALGLTLDQFDTEFFKWVDDKVKNLEVKPFTELISSGQEALAKGDTDKAIQILDQAIELYPEYTDEHNAYEPLADAYLKKGDKKAAIDILKKFMTYSETGYKASVKLADLLREQGDVAGARQALEAGMFIRPMDLEEHQKLGDLLLGLKQYAAAVREFESLLALNTPDKATAYYKLAESSFGQGNRQAARTSIMKALEIAPSYEPAQELLLKIVR